MKTYIENTTTVSETFSEGRFTIVKYWDTKLQRDNEKAFETQDAAYNFIKTL
jgi:hypothetical protein